jgi:hypothetical protein
VKTLRQVWRIAWRLGVCVGLLGWVFHAIFLNEGREAWEAQGQSWSQLGRWEQWQVGWAYGPPELWHTLSRIRPAEGALSLVCMGLTLVLGMLRWRMVMRVQGLDLPLGRTAEISLVAHFFNSFLLGSTGGDLIKAYYAARETHHLKTEAVVTVFVDRLIGLVSMLLFATLMMAPNFGLLAAHRRLAALAWLVVLMLLAGAVVVGLSFWGGLSRLWPQARAWLRRLPKGDWLERSLEACRRFGQEHKLLAQALGLSMVLNLVCVLQVWSLARGLNLAISPVALLVIVPVIICISALPITVSGLGVRENLYVWMLAAPQIAIGATEALSLSLLAYAGSLFWSLIGGLTYVTFKARHHLADVVATETTETTEGG